MPWEGVRWALAEQTGWTLDYIDNDVSDVDIQEWLQYRRGQALANKPKGKKGKKGK